MRDTLAAVRDLGRPVWCAEVGFHLGETWERSVTSVSSRLTKLKKAGLLSMQRGNAKRSLYTITDAGRAALAVADQRGANATSDR